MNKIETLTVKFNYSSHTNNYWIWLKRWELREIPGIISVL